MMTDPAPDVGWSREINTQADVPIPASPGSWLHSYRRAPQPYDVEDCMALQRDHNRQRVMSRLSDSGVGLDSGRARGAE